MALTKLTLHPDIPSPPIVERLFMKRSSFDEKYDVIYPYRIKSGPKLKFVPKERFSRKIFWFKIMIPVYSAKKHAPVIPWFFWKKFLSNLKTQVKQLKSIKATPPSIF